MKLSRVALIAAVVAASTLWAVPAHAAVSNLRGTTLYYVAGPGERNIVTIRLVLDVYVIDDAVPIDPGEGCAHDGADLTVVLCNSDIVEFVQIELGDRDDFVDYQGPDNSNILGGDGPDTLYGGSGRDFFDGGNGDDYTNGRGGDDKFLWSPGADRMYGGAGWDRASYAHAPGPVIADLDGDPDDGIAGELDLIFTDVENLEGSPFDDMLTGDDLDNDLNGNGGDDTLFGRGGDDLLYGDRNSTVGLGADGFSGGAGIDTVSYIDHTAAQPVRADADNVAGDDGMTGEGDTILADVENFKGSPGNDILTGGAGGNVLSGGDGNDYLVGLAGVDSLYGEAGNDHLFGGDGLDSLYGGDGDDFLYGQGGPDGMFGGAGSDFCDDTSEDIVADSC